MTLAVETKNNEDGSIEWTNYTVKDLFPPTPPDTEIESSSSSCSSTKSDKDPEKILPILSLKMNNLKLYKKQGHKVVHKNVS